MTRRLDVLVCSGAACVSSHSAKVREALSHEIAKRDLAEEVRIVETGCMGPCELGPVILVYPDGAFYIRVTPEDAAEIVEEHFLKGRPVKRLLWEAPEARRIVESKKQVPFFEKQKKVVLHNCGRIDPENIEEYIAGDGYEALGRALTEMTPEEIIGEVKASGLRGRGGAGFPTGVKWGLVRQAPGDEKYVICNAGSSAEKDRVVLEGDPHSVIEGMAIAAYAVGARKGYIYVRAECPLAVKHVRVAIAQAYKLGLLGDHILETSFSFDIALRTGGGAFACGEETALIASIEGERGQPHFRPPYPDESGLWNEPTLVNNVETLANIRHIILKGVNWFHSIGTATSPGTKIVALSGQVHNAGIIEVPIGTTLRKLIFDIGGGIPGKHHFKAVLVGGPLGGCLPEEILDVPIDYEPLSRGGAMMGSGSVIVLDDTFCMVNIAKFFLEFSCEESCGQCVPCRVGLPQMLEILKRITSGNGSMEDIDRLKELSKTIIESSFCGLGKTAPNPVLSTLQYFAEEYREHIEEKRCRAKVCTDLITYRIDEDACKACDRCRRDCPAEAISGEPGKPPYLIDDEICVKCGTCVEVCPFGAVHVLTGEQALKSDRKEGSQ